MVPCPAFLNKAINIGPTENSPFLARVVRLRRYRRRRHNLCQQPDEGLSRFKPSDTIIG